MKIIVDIGHPAHVHYFRNLIKIMSDKGHSFLIIARDKDVTFTLLNEYKIPFISRGKGEKSLIGKILYIIKADWCIMKAALKYEPDLFLSFSSPYAAHISFLLKKPSISFNDTEHAISTQIMFVPFTSVILTPISFLKDYGKKQIKFSGYMELCALHPKYFKADPFILSSLRIAENEKFVIMRFVSWSARHDVGHHGLSLEMKKKIVFELSKFIKVFISSEGELPPELTSFQITISPEKIHDVLAYSSLFIGEGATMASECALLGTPAIYINSLDAGTLQEQEKYGLLYSFRNSEGVFEKALELLNTPNIKEIWRKRKLKMLEDKIDVMAFMVWFVENYPDSFRIMKENPDYQYKFK
jgi:predicted glycosyltransferase